MRIEDVYFPVGATPYPCPLKGGCGHPCGTDWKIALEETVYEDENGGYQKGRCYQLNPPEPFLIPEDEIVAEFERQAKERENAEDSVEDVAKKILSEAERLASSPGTGTLPVELNIDLCASMLGISKRQLQRDEKNPGWRRKVGYPGRFVLREVYESWAKPLRENRMLGKAVRERAKAKKTFGSGKKRWDEYD